MTLIIPVGDGIADDTAAVQSHCDEGVRLPPGTFRVTAPIGATATVSGIVNTGIKLRGAGMLKTQIVADYDGDEDHAGVINLTADAVGKYTVASRICDLEIVQAVGRTGLNGIQLTAGWFVEIDKVKIKGMSGTGIKVPLRTDLHPTISDGYQNFSVIVSQSWIANNAKWGIDFGAGQSPGLYKIELSAIANNAGGGIRTTTGHSQIVENLIVGNGTHGTSSGGLFFDSVEGPSTVMMVARNEFDTNYNWHMNIIRSRGMEVRQNRFLSQTYSAAQGGSLQSGGAYMRPWVHVTMGAGATKEVWGALFIRNTHRSVTGAGPTTPTVIAYTASGGSLSATHPNRFERNDFGPMPANGIIQNSTGLIKFSGLSGTGAEIVDP